MIINDGAMILAPVIRQVGLKIDAAACRGNKITPLNSAKYLTNA